MPRAFKTAGFRACTPSRAAGFTLLELVVTLSVAVILVIVAVPTFTSITRNNRAAADTNDLAMALAYARSTATQRGRPVNVCSSTNGTSCNGTTDWSSGWIAIVPGTTPELLRVWPSRGAANVLTTTVTTLQFQARGSVAAAVTFTLRRPQCTGNQQRNIIVNVAGSHSIQRAACP